MLLFFYSLTWRKPVRAVNCKDNDILLNSPYILHIKFHISHLSSCKNHAKAKVMAKFGRFW